MRVPRLMVAAVAAGSCVGGGLSVAVALGSAEAKASPAPLLVSVSAGGITPGKARSVPGERLAFVDRATNPVVISRTAAPFALAITLQPGTTSPPTAVPSATGSYRYTAQSQLLVVGAVALPAAKPPLAGIVVVSPPKSERARIRKPGPSARPSAGTSTPSLSALGLADGVVIPPAVVPSYAAGPAVPLPELPLPELPLPGLPLPGLPLPGLPTAPASTSSRAAGGPAVPTVAVTAPSASTQGAETTYAPQASTYGVGVRQGPRRGRGLPIAIAVVLLLGVGSGVARAANLGRFVTRTTLLPRKVRGR